MLVNNWKHNLPLSLTGVRWWTQYVGNRHKWVDYTATLCYVWPQSHKSTPSSSWRTVSPEIKSAFPGALAWFFLKKQILHHIEKWEFLTRSDQRYHSNDDEAHNNQRLLSLSNAQPSSHFPLAVCWIEHLLAQLVTWEGQGVGRGWGVEGERKESCSSRLTFLQYSSPPPSQPLVSPSWSGMEQGLHWTVCTRSCFTLLRIVPNLCRAIFFLPFLRRAWPFPPF